MRAPTLPRAVRPRAIYSAARERLPRGLFGRVALLVPLLLGTKLVAEAVKRIGGRQGHLSSADRQALIEDLRELVPAPPPHALGGEVVDSDTYQRFLQVQGWSVPKAAEMMGKDLEWRRRIRPRAIHPRSIATACSQRGWLVLMRHHGSNLLMEVDEPHAPAANTSRPSTRGFLSRWRLPRNQKLHLPHPHLHFTYPHLHLPHAFHRHAGPSLHPPHVKPALAHWVYTRHGMPVTYINVKAWRPTRYKSKDECTRFCAYHMEHYIRRMPSRQGRCVGGAWGSVLVECLFHTALASLSRASIDPIMPHSQPFSRA